MQIHVSSAFSNNERPTTTHDPTHWVSPRKTNHDSPRHHTPTNYDEGSLVNDKEGCSLVGQRKKKKESGI